MNDVDVYPVGWLAAFRRMRHHHKPRNRPRHWPISQEWHYMVRQAKAGHWKDVKNCFNGYLAEPSEFPPGLTRCGTGWTRKRALRDLDRRMRKATR